MNKNLVPANLDEKNITTDWIGEQLFDFDENYAYKSIPFSTECEYLGYVDSTPILLRFSCAHNWIDIKLCGVRVGETDYIPIKSRIEKIFEDTDFKLTFRTASIDSFEVRFWWK